MKSSSIRLAANPQLLLFSLCQDRPPPTWLVLTYILTSHKSTLSLAFDTSTRPFEIEPSNNKSINFIKSFKMSTAGPLAFAERAEERFPSSRDKLHWDGSPNMNSGQNAYKRFVAMAN